MEILNLLAVTYEAYTSNYELKTKFFLNEKKLKKKK